MRDASDVRRVAAIGGVTAAAVVMLLLGKPVFFATTAPKVAVAQATETKRAETKTAVAFVTSPVIDPDPEFFFGAGDNSNGYYGSGKPTLVRYSRMP
jgi:hypothetical protein